MAKRQKQMEIPDIDNTPLAEALTEAARAKEIADDAEKAVDEAKEKVLKEMRQVNIKRVTQAGFVFAIDEKEATTKLKMTRIKE